MRLERQRGLTLVELMISLTIGLVVLGAASSVYITTVTNSVSSIAASRLNQELMTLMNVMVLDIRRAGYWADAASDPIKNPFNTANVTALAVRESMDNPITAANSGNCILYAYDSDDDGILTNDEAHGFRLNEGVIQMRRVGVKTGAGRYDDCANAADTWEDITDGNLIKIRSLTFNSADSSCLNMREPDGLDNGGASGADDDEEYDCIATPPATGDITVEVRQIAITLEGELTSDSDVRVSLSQSVRVRNDLVRER